MKREVAQVPGSQRCPVKQVALSAGVGVSEKLRGLDLRAHAGFRGEGAPGADQRSCASLLLTGSHSTSSP